jgi:hypothetical protein
LEELRESSSTSQVYELELPNGSHYQKKRLHSLLSLLRWNDSNLPGVSPLLGLFFFFLILAGPNQNGPIQ